MSEPIKLSPRDFARKVESQKSIILSPGIGADGLARWVLIIEAEKVPEDVKSILIDEVLLKVEHRTPIDGTIFVALIVEVDPIIFEEDEDPADSVAIIDAEIEAQTDEFLEFLIEEFRRDPSIASTFGRDQNEYGERIAKMEKVLARRRSTAASDPDGDRGDTGGPDVISNS